MSPEYQPHRTATAIPRPLAWAMLVVVVAAVVIISLVSRSGGGDHTQVGGDDDRTGRLAPSVVFTYFDGSAGSFADYQGKPLVVNFWASWCPSCVAEMSAAFRPVQLDVGDQVSFLGLNIQDDRTNALRLVEHTGVLFDLAEDPRGDAYIALGGLAMPFTVFVSPEGTIVHKHNGPLSQSQLAALIDQHLLGT